MLKLKLQYFGHLMWRTDSLEETLILGKTEGRRREQRMRFWMASLTQWTWVWAKSRSCDGQGNLTCCSPGGHKESDTTEQPTKLNFKILYASLIVTTREKPLVIIQKNIIGKTKLIPKDIKTHTKKTAG